MPLDPRNVAVDESLQELARPIVQNLALLVDDRGIVLDEHLGLTEHCDVEISQHIAQMLLREG